GGRCERGGASRVTRSCSREWAAASPGAHHWWRCSRVKYAMVFPGQGSQSAGMLAGYGDMPAIRETLAEASDVLKQDLAKLIAEGPAEELNRTVNTQPVMVTAGICAWRAWREAGGADPALLAGPSLGRHAALAAAGATP